MDPLDVGGLRDLVQTFRELVPALATAWRAELKEIAEPVRAAAEANAEDNIPHIGAAWARSSFGGTGAPWAQMRIGVSVDTVYIAPKARNKGGSKRKNLAGLLEKQMDDALEEKTPEIVARMGLMVDRLIERYG